MLRRLLIVSLFVFHGLGIYPSFADQKKSDIASLIPVLETYVEQYRELYETPGVAIVIVKDGQVYTRSFGALSLNDKTPVDADTVFQIASVTKNFTATLMVRLAEKGLLSLDDKVTKYLPDFELSKKEVTDDLRLRDLLCHCTGLEDFAGDTLWHGRLPQEEVLTHMRHLPFVGKFRESYAYSNIMVGIAGLIIEKVMGRNIHHVMREEFFDPLGMTYSSVGFEGVVPKASLIDRMVRFFSGKNSYKIAKPHDLYDGKAKELAFNDEFYLFPGSSGVNITANDMGKWLLFHLNNYKVGNETFISPEHIADMRRSYVDGSKELVGQQFPKERVTKVDLGLGWFMYDFGVDSKRIHVLEQMGGICGARALMAIVPSENLGIAVLANLGGMRASLFPEALVQKFFDIYLGIEGMDWAKKIHDKFVQVKNKVKLQLDAMRLQNPQPHRPLKVYVGRYTNKLYGDVKIILEGDKDLFIFYRGYKIPIKHLNGDRFVCRGRELSEGYSFDDECIVEFGIEGNVDKSYGVMLSLFDEGENPAFYRQD